MYAVVECWGGYPQSVKFFLNKLLAELHMESVADENGAAWNNTEEYMVNGDYVVRMFEN